ncbi:MAG: ribonuclease PH [Bdellovibrionales bacterium GWB1_55_8]|nr:MAG: ribonuclease PH [Bdellovibrionales bacterium GWB1_55_8]
MNARQAAGRTNLDIRTVSIDTNVNLYAEGSVLIRSGNTHVLCTASVEESVPGWMKGTGKGWITAEYSMLPRATHTRGKRDREKISGRTQEIQRLIGRALRSMVKLESLGERSILVDCDVLQADGGTRTASITGACVAVGIALKRLEREKKLAVPLAEIWLDTVAAVSVGIAAGEPVVDLDYSEDSTCDVDMNFVITGKGLFVEVQGTAERGAFSKTDLDRMTAAAQVAVEKLKKIQLRAMEQ